jgi:flagellar motor switch protein FliM
MPNELNPGEISVRLPATPGAGSAEANPANELKVEPWDVRRAGQMGREQLQAITKLHEGFARSLTHSLGAYLRVVFTAALVSAEHLTYRDFLQRIPETTYLASCRLEPMGVRGALQLDLNVVFPIVDLLLGGEGKGVAAAREITAIEEQIVESVARIVCRELAKAWQAEDLEVGFEKRMEPGEAQRLLLPDEKTLFLSFAITVLEVRGGMNLALPVSVSHALLRKILVEQGDRRPRGRSVWRERLKRRLLECPFSVELGVNELRAAVGELSQLAPGRMLSLRRGAAQPASLLVAGVEMFRAVPARSGDTRAAQVLATGGEREAVSAGSAVSAGALTAGALTSNKETKKR